MNRLLLTFALFSALSAPSHALLLSFDNGSTTEGTGRPLSTSFSVDSAFLETEDEFGEPLPVAVWTPIEPAAIGNPADAGYGDPISGSGALNAEFDQILFTFESSIFLRGFSVILDNSEFGNLGDSFIQFFDSKDGLLAEIAFNQTILGLQVEWDGEPVGGVRKILLPSGAYYDDVVLNVPESGRSLAMLAGGMVVLSGARRLLGKRLKR